MKILAVETSTKTAYVSIAEAENNKAKPIVSYMYEAPSHTTALMKMIDSALKLSGIALDDIDLYAAAVGPGSFTGVRIGVSVIKGLAFADSKPCVGVSSLDALAYSLKKCHGIVTPMIDARRGTFYTSIYLANGDLTKLANEQQLEFDDYHTLIRDKVIDQRLILTGDAADMNFEKLKNIGVDADVVDSNAAYGAALAAYVKYTNGNKDEFNDINLVPVYLKKSQAEREREERLASLNK